MPRLIVSPELREVIMLFLRLGTTAFGGPAAHIAMMHSEVVTKKKWLTDREFLDLNSAANLIPGPNSTELAIHLGYVRAGWLGLAAAGVCFIVPAMLIVMGLAWAYVTFGTLPEVGALFYGIKPVVIVIVAQALWLLGRKAVKNVAMGIVGALVLGAYILGVNELALLFAAGLVILILEIAQDRKTMSVGVAVPFLAGALERIVTRPLSIAPALLLALPTAFSLPILFFTFLKIGSVLYGSGYVLLAFLQREFVENLGWLTQQQLLDAVAVGQFTPGPVFTTATFIGYILGGVPGAVLATIGIFLPAFVLVALTTPFVPRLRASKWLSHLLDGVNVASAGLMAGVTLQLAQAALVDVPTILIAISAAILLFRFQMNATWLVLGGALVGLGLSFVPH